MLSANALARDAAIFRGVRRDVRRPHALVSRKRTSSEADEALLVSLVSLLLLFIPELSVT
jgi:hypothetical protein